MALSSYADLPGDEVGVCRTSGAAPSRFNAGTGKRDRWGDGDQKT
jgi:hypothetical protein